MSDHVVKMDINSSVLLQVKATVPVLYRAKLAENSFATVSQVISKFSGELLLKRSHQVLLPLISTFISLTSYRC